jgi:hypothetical protein
VLRVEHPLDDVEVASQLRERGDEPADPPSPPTTPAAASFAGRRTYTRPSDQLPVASPSPPGAWSTSPSPSPPPPPPPTLGEAQGAWCIRLDHALDTMGAALSQASSSADADDSTALLAAVDAVDELVEHSLSQPQVHRRPRSLAACVSYAKPDCCIDAGRKPDVDVSHTHASMQLTLLSRTRTRVARPSALLSLARTHPPS